MSNSEDLESESDIKLHGTDSDDPLQILHLKVVSEMKQIWKENHTPSKKFKKNIIFELPKNNKETFSDFFKFRTAQTLYK